MQPRLFYGYTAASIIQVLNKRIARSILHEQCSDMVGRFLFGTYLLVNVPITACQERRPKCAETNAVDEDFWHPPALAAQGKRMANLTSSAVGTWVPVLP